MLDILWTSGDEILVRAEVDSGLCRDKTRWWSLFDVCVDWKDSLLSENDQALILFMRYEQGAGIMISMVSRRVASLARLSANSLPATPE